MIDLSLGDTALIRRAAPLLAFIANPESDGDYNIVWDGIKKHHWPKKPLVKMSVRQVLAWQDRIDPLYMSEAAGCYQIMEDTLRGMYRSAGVSLEDLFDEGTQDRLAVHLLRRRGLDDYLEGKISTEKFAQAISKEWASMPCIIKDKRGRPANGQSYYAGDGLNSAHVSRDDFLAAVESILALPPADHVEPEAPTPNKDKLVSYGIGAAIAALLAALTQCNFGV